MASRAEVFKKLKDNPKLPTPSRTALHILQLCRDDASSLSEIAQVIQVDPALSAELLKYANSAFLYTGIPVASIQRATVKLGMKTVVNLALCFSLLSANQKGKCWEFNYDAFWSRSLAQAIAAKNIAGLCKKHDPEEMFVCGLLCHIGELALASLYPQEYGKIIGDQPAREIKMELEKSHFGIDSAELTSELFLDWGLPDRYALAVRFHHDPGTADLAEPATRTIAELLYVACRIGLLCNGETISRQWIDRTEDMALNLEGMTEDFGTLFDTVVNHWQQWGDTFNIKTKRCSPYADLKAASPGNN